MTAAELNPRLASDTEWDKQRRNNGIDGDTTPPDGPPKPGNQILSGADFVASFIPPDWLIDGIIQRRRLYACTSLTGHGKTAVWLYNACMIQAGRKVGHLEAGQGNV